MLSFRCVAYFSFFVFPFARMVFLFAEEHYVIIILRIQYFQIVPSKGFHNDLVLCVIQWAIEIVSAKTVKQRSIL